VRLLVLGAGYVGAKLAEVAIDDGHEVVLADNWWASGREQLAGLEQGGARVETVDIRDAGAVRALLATSFDRVHLLAAQASRPLSISEPAYTEQTNLVGPRIVAEALADHAPSATLVYASSLHVYGSELSGEVGADRPYGGQGDLAHLSKIYAELCLDLYARRHGFGLALLRLGIGSQRQGGSRSSTRAGARRSASYTSRTSRGFCWRPRGSPGSPPRMSRRRPSPCATSRGWRRANPPRTSLPGR
jgi:nucleoside-diphosphate-sugar epimerase